MVTQRRVLHGKEHPPFIKKARRCIKRIQEKAKLCKYEKEKIEGEQKALASKIGKALARRMRVPFSRFSDLT
jgi:hypothetical protein